MATSQIKNARQIFIGNGTAALSGVTVVSPADGEIIILNESGQRVTDSNVNTTTKFRLVLGRTGESDLVSDLIETSTISNANLGVGAARANQVTTIGYDGTSGSLPVTNSNLYYVRLYIQEFLSSNSDGQRMKHGVYKSDASAIQQEIALGLVSSLINNFLREAEKYITFEVRCNHAGGIVPTGVGTVAVVNGSDTITFSTAVDNATGATLLLVNELLRFGTATTDDVYKIKSIDVPTETIVLDRKYQGASVAAMANNTIERITVAQGIAADWGVVLTGADLSFGAPDYKYSMTRWETQLENFGTTTAVIATGASEGLGTYESIASLESFLMGGYGEIYRIGTPNIHPQVLVAESAVAGGHYTLCTFNFKDSKVTGSFSEEVSPKSMIIACPTDCGPFALSSTAHSLGKLLTTLAGITVTWTT